MIQTHETQLGQSVILYDLYQYLELRDADYSRFVNLNLIENPYLEDGKDYYAFVRSENLGKRGKFRQDYYVHIDAAKKLCMVSRSAKGEQIRNELVEMTKQIENKGLLTHKEVIAVVQMVKVFAIMEFRTKARENHQDLFVSELSAQYPFANKGQFHARFNKWRNEMLGLGKEELNKRLKDYCIATNNISAKKLNITQEQAMAILGQYEQIKVAVWDLLLSQKKSEQFAMNVSLLAQEIAQQIKPQLERFNRANMFFEPIPESEIKKLGL